MSAMKKCVNSFCGLSVRKERDICYRCSWFKKLNKVIKVMDGYYFSKCMDRNGCYLCQYCCDMKKIENLNICDNCGDNKTNSKRFCDKCERYSKPCLICSKRMYNLNIDFCDNLCCVEKTRKCQFSGCKEDRLENNEDRLENNEDRVQYFTCKLHMCNTPNCFNIIVDRNSSFCIKCKCVMYCSKPKIGGSEYCSSHKCPNPQCKYRRDCCDDHMCYYCDNIIYKGVYCKKHVCSEKNCIDATSRIENYTATNLFKFCSRHKCDDKYCDKGKYNDLSFCEEHSCIVSRCNSKTYTQDLFCQVHNNYPKKIRCKSCGHKNCQMKYLAQIMMDENYEYDIVLVQKKLRNNFPDFANAMAEIIHCLLKILHTNTVPKDIRKIIVNYFLHFTIISEFKKTCYNCKIVCKQEICKMVGWPNNKNCPVHTCSINDCRAVKVKGSQFCDKHKCSWKCNSEIVSGTMYCNIHLCPLCRKNGATGKRNHCKRCRCHKRINNNTLDEKYQVRCDNPVVVMGANVVSDYCWKHQN